MTKEFIEKHLARNVPTNFDECCAHIRAELRPRTRKVSWKDRDKGIVFDAFYLGMIGLLVEGDVTSKLDSEIGNEIFEVQVRFEAIQRTIDFNVPAKPIYDRLIRLKRSVNAMEQSLLDDERDENIRKLKGLELDAPLPQSLVALREASSIAERASITQGIFDVFGSQLDELIEFFDYKRGKVTRGQPSVYATLYAVAALADVFERNNYKNLKANVQQIPNRTGGYHANEYTGLFLEFVMQFFFAVDHAEVERFSHTGMHDTIRKHAKSRKKDGDFFKLLHEDEVGYENLLKFMMRAEAM